ncbi:tautomerase family protein [Pantoea sp. A4]|uniref:tautomerase family protein n=1 Tax=Pantoea sp. A4 TaxID=1225184 RepID=UPI0008FADAA6|nr:tautomerase family protein [Pantoea sp. A4]
MWPCNCSNPTLTNDRKSDMPMIRVEMLTGRTEAQRIELVEALTRETARIAKCPAADIQVIVSEVERTHWAVGGVLNKVSSESNVV